ncbi:unnamed protein product [Clonostachys rosea]|uniref:Cucumopine synthase C-terminal helical bundle domain-containing protein n=1 Tax=Bionectria ochroleuca TaxID=29856 RepID=A0ABY6TY10_BIOOC|nr:unnamed protein product [Clonostachys rosea]
MELPRTITVAGPGPGFTFRIRLQNDANPEVVQGILSRLPLETFCLHVVVAGETIYMPAPSISLGSKNMVERRMGTVYFNTTSQSICFCYGAVTESTKVNQFARVLEEDLPNLIDFGKLVYQETISQKLPKIVPISIRLNGSNAPSASPSLDRQTLTTPIGDWKSVKQIIDRKCEQLRRPEEPDEIKKIRLGAVQTLAGGESSPFQATIFLQGFLSTLGPHVFSRLLSLSEEPGIDLSLMIRQTKVFLLDTFDHFKFLNDLGLKGLDSIGAAYEQAFASLESLDDYRALTDSVRTLIQLYYRWIHLTFPWYLKSDFPGRTDEEVAALPKLEVYNSAENRI